MNRIAEWREKRGWGQVELAEAAETTQATISRLEGGRQELTVEWMTRLAPILGCNPVDLIDTALVAEVRNDVQLHEEGTDPSIIAAIRARGLLTYKVLTNVVDTVGLSPGSIIVVDITTKAIESVRCGNVVIALVRAKAGGREGLVLRRFLFPNLLTTHRLTGRDVSLKLGDPDFDIEIKGVVQRDSAD
jgi:transcriptional regulator with XRE-family HTH domain